MSRHWKWIVAVCCLAALLFIGGIGGFIVLISRSMRSSSVYTDAIARAKSAPAVTAALGTPLKDGFLVAGSIAENDSWGSARLMIPLNGPKGSGHLSVYATRSQGAWHFSDLTLLIDSTRRRIDLLNTNQ